MSRLQAALVLGTDLLVAGASHAQAANNHSPHWKFGLIDGLGLPPVLVLDSGEKRISAIDLPGPGYEPGPGDGPPEKPSGPDWKTQFEENTTNGDKWSSNQVDGPDGQWQQNTTSQDTPQWTTQTVTRDDP